MHCKQTFLLRKNFGNIGLLVKEYRCEFLESKNATDIDLQLQLRVDDAYLLFLSRAQCIFLRVHSKKGSVLPHVVSKDKTGLPVSVSS